MIVTFEEDYLKELFVSGRCKAKKHRYQPQIIKAYQRRIEMLQAAPTPETLYQFAALHFEALKGNRIGRYSIRVNDKYRVEFTLSQHTDNTVLTICNIVELSNHYD